MDSEASFHAKQLFVQGSYSACIATITSLPTASPALRLYAARSHLALGDTAAAIKLAPGSSPSARAVRLLAQRPANAVEEALALLNTVAEGNDEFGVTSVVVGTILQLNGQTGEALRVLNAGAKAEDQECVALLVQVLLSQDRLDLAKAVYEQARIWAEDALSVQLCEAWIGLRAGGDAYQSAYYVFEEISQAPSGNNPVVLIGKAAAQSAQGNWPEAEAALAEASELKPDFAATLANQAALSSVTGKGPQSLEVVAKLQLAAPNHPLLADLAEKASIFDEAASKYTAAAA